MNERPQAGDEMSENDEPAERPVSSPSLALRALRALNAGAEAPPAVDLAKPVAEPEPETVEGPEAVPEPEADPEPEVEAEPVAPVVDGLRPAVEPERAQRRYGVPIAAIVLVAAAVFAALSAVSWYRAGHDDTRSHAAVRDAALRGARIDIETVNTSDYRNPARVLDSWTAVSTGALAAQYKTNRSDAISVLTKAKVVTKATVLDAAITTLDLKRSRATVIASVDVVRTPASGTAARTRNRFKATVQKVGSSWRLSGLEIVSVQLS